jgi:hypothetical protein
MKRRVVDAMSRPLSGNRLLPEGSGARRRDEWNATARSTPMTVIRMRDYGPRVRSGVHAQQVHDQITKAVKASSHVRLDFTDVLSVGETFLDRSLGALVAWHGAAVLRLLVFAHCSPSVAASISKAVPQAGPIEFSFYEAVRWPTPVPGSSLG